MEEKPGAPPLDFSFAFDDKSFSDAELHIVENESMCPKRALPPEVLRVIDAVRPPAEEQRRIISGLLHEKWSENQTAYVLNVSWWKSFKSHVNLKEEPGLMSSLSERKDAGRECLSPSETTTSSAEEGTDSSESTENTASHFDESLAEKDKKSETSSESSFEIVGVSALDECKRAAASTDSDHDGPDLKEFDGDVSDSKEESKCDFDVDLIAIDNSSLRGKHPHELRSDLAKGYDYVLVSSEVWKHLHRWYGGGPCFSRVVESLTDNRYPKVCLYPTFVRLCWTDDNGDPSLEDVELLAVPPSVSPRQLVGVYRKAGNSGELRKSIRAWYRRGEKQDSNTDSRDPWQIMKPSEARKTFDDWKWSHGDVIMLEERPSLPDEHGALAPWRRFAPLHHWADIEVGDVIDALDSLSKWYESRVLAVDDHQVKVHYIGWNTRWDEWISRDAKRLAERGTHTNGPYSRESSDDSGTTADDDENRVVSDGLAAIKVMRCDTASLLPENSLSLNAKEPEKKSSVFINKAILSASSEYFRGMFTVNMLEATESRVVLEVGPGQTAACMDMIRNVYSEPFARTDPAHLFNVILLSDRFSFEHVAKSSCYMVAQLKDPDLNVCEALLSLPESITKAKWFAAVRNRLEKALLSDSPTVKAMTKACSTKHLPLRTFHALLSSDNFSVASENTCLLWVLDWFTYHRDTKESKDPENIKMLLGALRLGCMDNAYVVNVVRHVRIGNDKIGIESSALQDALIYHSLSSAQRRAFCADFDEPQKLLHRSRGEKRFSFSEGLRLLPRYPIDELHPHFSRVAIHGEYDHFRYSDFRLYGGFILTYCLHWSEDQEIFEIRLLVKLTSKAMDFAVPYLTGKLEEICIDHTDFDESGASIDDDRHVFYSEDVREFYATFDAAESAFVIESRKLEKCDDFNVDKIRVLCTLRL